METMFEANIVKMTLAEFLIFRDALKFKEEIREVAMASRKTYGNQRERDIYEIGNAVLDKLNIPLEAEDEEKTDDN